MAGVWCVVGDGYALPYLSLVQAGDVAMRDDKIYVISSGSYSDYGVHAVFETKEDAEAFVTVTGDDGKVYECFEVEERFFYRKGEQPEKIIWYSGTMDVNQAEPIIHEHSEYAWDWDAGQAGNKRPKITFTGWNRTPGFSGLCDDRELLAKALHERTVKYRAELDQLLKDVHGGLVKLAGNPPRPVMTQEIAIVLGREVEDVGWAVQELKNAGMLDDVSREIKREEIEPPEPLPPGKYRIPIMGRATKPPKPSEPTDG